MRGNEVVVGLVGHEELATLGKRHYVNINAKLSEHLGLLSRADICMKVRE
jgi:hypothetical protein